jgi:hypothetical protein
MALERQTFAARPRLPRATLTKNPRPRLAKPRATQTPPLGPRFPPRPKSDSLR